MKKVLFLGIPFFCTFLSTLFFFGYIVWFDNGFRHDDEYTLEELWELEQDYMRKGGMSSNQSMKKKKSQKVRVKFKEHLKDRGETSFMNGLEMGSNPETNRTDKSSHLRPESGSVMDESNIAGEK
jgi:hypothetical protein